MYVILEQLETGEYKYINFFSIGNVCSRCSFAECKKYPTYSHALKELNEYLGYWRYPSYESGISKYKIIVDYLAEAMEGGEVEEFYILTYDGCPQILSIGECSQKDEQLKNCSKYTKETLPDLVAYYERSYHKDKLAIKRIVRKQKIEISDITQKELATNTLIKEKETLEARLKEINEQLNRKNDKEENNRKT